MSQNIVRLKSKIFLIGLILVIVSTIIASPYIEVFADQLSEGHNYIVNISDSIEFKDNLDLN